MGGTEVAGAISNSHTIASLTRSQDGAEVTCTATNSVGSSVMTSSVNITCESNLSISLAYFERSSLLTSLWSPPDGAFFLSEPEHVAADVGDTVTLRCDVSGNPAPTVQWTRSGSSTVQGLGVTLTINDVTDEDFGTYECRATSQMFGSVSRRVHLLKNGPPVVVSGSEASARRGSTVTLECDVISRPEADSVTWQRGEDGEVIQNDKR